MKNRKIIALLLAAAMSFTMLGVTACTKTDVSESEEDEEIETEVVETEAVATETEFVETTIAETEPAVETEVAQPDIVSPNENNDADAIAYALFMEFVRNGSFDSGAEFAFDYCRYTQDDPVDSRWGLVVKINDEITNYAVINGHVEATTMGYDWFNDSCLSREAFLQLPMMISDVRGEFGLSSEIENGTYYGSLLAMNTSGTRVFALIAYPIIIDEAAYGNLSGATSFTDIYGETYTLESPYTEYDNIIYDESGRQLYGWFTSNGDGTYRLISESDYTMSHNGTLCYIDIADNCEIVDSFAWLAGAEDPSVGVNPEAPLTLINSHYYDTMINYEYGNAYNGWVQGYSAILEPVVVENGQITSMVLGWR